MILPSLESNEIDLNFSNGIFKIVKYEEMLFVNDPLNWSVIYDIDNKNWSWSPRPVALQHKKVQYKTIFAFNTEMNKQYRSNLLITTDFQFITLVVT